MLESLENGIGLDIVLWLQEMRGGFLDIILKILDFAGGELFYIAAFGLIYWAFNKRLGMRMLFALISIALVNSLVKDFFARPRPYQVSEAVNELFTEESYGIPSGHVAVSMMIWGYLVFWLRKNWVTAVVVIYIILQFFGRMIAGVHFPQAVIAGVIVAGITLAIYIRYAEKIVDFWKEQNLSVQIGIPIGLAFIGLIAIIMLPLKPAQVDDYGTLSGLLWGAGLAAALEAIYIKFQQHESILRRTIHFVVGMALAVLVLIGLGIAFDAIAETGTLAAILRVIRYGIVAAFALAIWPWLSIRLNLMQTNTELG
jgi:membrane-associated phospholipid phosphatase